jgi:hypothetical protein
VRAPILTTNESSGADVSNPPNRHPIVALSQRGEHARMAQHSPTMVSLRKSEASSRGIGCCCLRLCRTSGEFLTTCADSRRGWGRMEEPRDTSFGVCAKLRLAEVALTIAPPGDQQIPTTIKYMMYQ